MDKSVSLSSGQTVFYPFQNWAKQICLWPCQFVGYPLGIYCFLSNRWILEDEAYLKRALINHNFVCTHITVGRIYNTGHQNDDNFLYAPMYIILHVWFFRWQWLHNHVHTTTFSTKGTSDSHFSKCRSVQYNICYNMVCISHGSARAAVCYSHSKLKHKVVSSWVSFLWKIWMLIYKLRQMYED